MYAVMSGALRTEFDDVPEPLAEVPAPPGGSDVIIPAHEQRSDRDS